MSITRYAYIFIFFYLSSSLLSCSSMTNGKYYWDNVPYCKVEDGKIKSIFKKPSLWVLQSHSNGSGHFLLDGSRLDQSPMTSGEVLVAVISCEEESLSRLPQKPMSEIFNKTTLPMACNGQKTILEPQLIKAEESSVAGYDGKIPFPVLPKEVTVCEQGTLSYGSIADKK